jgi:small-conductance mechanosensitive channel
VYAGMMRKLSFIFFLCLGLFSGIHSLYAQSDSNRKKNQPAGRNREDSEKNEVLTRQVDQIVAGQVLRMGDSVRLLQLNKELLQLGDADKSKKKALTEEQNQIAIRDSLNYARLKRQVDSIRSVMTGFPVVLGEDTLFYIFAKLGSFSPRDRALGFSTRLRELTDDYFFKPDSLKIIPGDFTTDITYKEQVVKSITEMDAVWENTSREKLAVKYKNIISAAIVKYKSENSWSALVKDILIAILVLSILVTILYYLARVFRVITVKIQKQRGKKIKGLKIKDYEILDAGHEVTLLVVMLRILKWLIIIPLVYSALVILFDIFPWTGGFSGKLLSYFLDPIKHILYSLWDYLPNLFTIIVLVIFFRYLLRILYFFKMEIERGRLKIPGFYVDWANPTFQIIRILMFAFMLIIIFPYLPGSDSPIFKGVSVFLGVLFTFGSAGALGNIVSGIVLTYMRAYKIGDRVQIGEVTGDVVEKSLLVTRIKTIKNEIVSIPNSSVMSNHTKNYSNGDSAHQLILYTSVTIGYDTPWRHIHELLIKAALATDLIEQDPAPFVFQNKLDDFYVNYQINAFTNSPNQQHITYSLLHQNIQDAFNAAGVEIMSSHYSNIRDGNKITVPHEHLPKDYIAPSFRVKNTDKDSKA